VPGGKGEKALLHLSERGGTRPLSCKEKKVTCALVFLDTFAKKKKGSGRPYAVGLARRKKKGGGRGGLSTNALWEERKRLGAFAFAAQSRRGEGGGRPGE